MPGNTRTRMWTAGALALAWAGVIWVLGSEPFSHSETSRILGPLLEWLLPGWTVEARTEIAAGIRKLAHPVEYGVFAVLVLRFVHARQQQRHGGSPIWLEIATSISVAALLAVLDEGRQTRLASRTGSPFDVGLDVLGAAVALALATWAASLAGGHLLGVPGFGSAGDERGDAPPSPPPAA